MSQEQQLQTFIDWWRAYCKGDEKGEAQVFLDRLFRALGYAGALEAGGIFERRVKRQQEDKITTAFADFVIPRRVLVEMKKRGENLRQHYDQALDYWIDLADQRPQYVILCNFDELWIYDFNHQPREPMDMVPVRDLVELRRTLAFLLPQPEAPRFRNNRVDVTQQAAQKLSQVFLAMVRRKVPADQAQLFILQCMLVLFAEDIDLLPSDIFTKIVLDARQNTNGDDRFYDLVKMLFYAMNEPGKVPAGRFYGVDYFNGGLFARVNPVPLGNEELRLMGEAAENYDWAKIHPGIFGTIFEQSMDADERHQIGGHYTSETDILRIVRPVITRPWRERILAAATIAELHALQDELRQYRVLDPACGSGNFLYVAYREMKALEHEIDLRLQALSGTDQLAMGFVTARQFYGFDIKPFAVELAKVTLMIARKLAVDDAHSPEHPLPLDNLDANIRCADALFEPWPEFDACIGNPPYLGAKRLKQEHSAEYVNRVRAAFPEVPGNADYCVYWIRKAHELMQPGTRAGLVGTNTIRQNYSRIGGLDYVVDNDGHIFEAFSTFPWSGEAAVSVSIACWSKGAPPLGPARLWVDDAKTVLELPAINSSLSAKTDVSSAQTLICNTEPKRVFQGQIPGHEAFVLSPDEARAMIRRDPASKPVILPFLIGRDLVAEPGGQPSRYVIDLNACDIIEAQQFKAAFNHVQEHILPVREAKAQQETERNQKARAVNSSAKINRHHEMFLRQWWKHSYGRQDMMAEISKLPRFIVCPEVSKRPIFDFVSPLIRPDHRLYAFAFSDDYSFGILQSNFHWQWWLAKGATLTDRPMYTPHSVFDTFPWPQNPTAAQVKAVALAARALHEYRREAMRKNPRLTLRDLYRSLEQPGQNPLKELHTKLDAAVLAAYGFDLTPQPPRHTMERGLPAETVTPRPEGEGPGAHRGRFLILLTPCPLALRGHAFSFGSPLRREGV